MTKFNIHKFNLDDYKNTTEYIELSKDNPIIEIIEKHLDYNTYLDNNYLSKYYNIKESNKKYIIFETDDQFKNIIKRSNYDCVLKNRLLLNKICKSYINKDNHNFLYISYENNNIVSSLCYKDFEKYAKMIKNLFLISLMKHIFNSKNDFISFINYFYHPLKKENTQSLFDEVYTWLYRILIKPNDFILDDFHSLLTNIGYNVDNIPYDNELHIYKNYNFIINHAYIQHIFFPKSYNKSIVNLINKLIKPQKLSINTAINKVFEYDKYIKEQLDNISYTKTIEKINPVSGFKSVCNTRIAIDEKNTEIVNLLAEQVNKLSLFQEDLNNTVNLELKKYNKYNKFNFEIVEGNAIKYYYNVNNYLDTGNPLSILKNGQVFPYTISKISGYSHIKSKEGQLFNSCMRYPSNQFNIDWYSKCKYSKLLILTNEYKTIIKGRAVIWVFNDKLYIDRIFTIDEDSRLEFINYINESNIIPIYYYTEYSGVKQLLYKSFHDTDYKEISFDYDFIKGTTTPYFDTLRNFLLISKNNKLYLSKMDDIIYINTCSFCNIKTPCYSINDRIFHYPLKKNNIKCDICGNIISNYYIDIKINDEIKHICSKNHIFQKQNILNNKKLLIDGTIGFSKILNVNKRFFFTKVNIVKLSNNTITNVIIDSKNYNKLILNEKYIFNFVKNLCNDKKMVEKEFSSNTIPYLSAFTHDEDYKNVKNNNYSFIKKKNIIDYIKNNNENKIFIKNELLSSLLLHIREYIISLSNIDNNSINMNIDGKIINIKFNIIRDYIRTFSHSYNYKLVSYCGIMFNNMLQTRGTGEIIKIYPTLINNLILSSDFLNTCNSKNVLKLYNFYNELKDEHDLLGYLKDDNIKDTYITEDENIAA